MPIAVAASIALLLLAGIGLVRRGWRGTLSDYHPICRRCGFDLFGLPSETSNCPECGADLSAPRATHIGHHKRSSRPLIAGSILIAIAVAGCIAFIVARAENLDVQQIKPVWLLARETRDPATHIAAMNELLRRFTAGELTQAQIDRVADEELAQQANTSRQWMVMSGMLIEQARAARKLSDERWKRYAQQALVSAVPADAVTVRAKVWRGEPLPVGVHLVPARMGVTGGKPLFVETNVTVTGELLVPPKPGTSWNLSFDQALQTAGGIDYHTYPAKMDRAKLDAAQDGPQTVHVSLETIVSEDPDYFLHIGKTPVLASKRFEFTRTWMLVPVGTKTVDLARDARLKAEMFEAFRVREVRHAKDQATLALEAKYLPIPIAVDILLRANEKTWKLSPVVSPFAVYTSGGPARNLTSDRVDVILHPDASVARRTVELVQIWGEDIVISDVPVHRQSSQDPP